jgi:hypothetical protein
MKGKKRCPLYIGGYGSPGRLLLFHSTFASAISVAPLKSAHDTTSQLRREQIILHRWSSIVLVEAKS